MSESWSLQYSDGNANLLHLWSDPHDGSVRYTYTPVTPKRSSSGLYTGGLPVRGGAPLELVALLWHQIRILAVDESLHTDVRTLGSAQFVLRIGDDETHFRVADGPQLKQFDAWLRSALRL